MNTFILEKRVSESILFDFDCTPNLATAEIISSVGAATSDQGGLVFGTAVVNTVPAVYPDGTTAVPGKVAQVRISAGLIPSGSVLPDGRKGIRCTVRLPYTTTPNGNTREATVLLDLTDTPD